MRIAAAELREDSRDRHSMASPRYPLHVMEIQHHPLPEAPWQGPESPRVNRQASGGALAFEVFAST